MASKWMAPRRWLAAGAAVVLAVLVLPQVVMAAEAFRWDKEVQRGQLDNGLNYYIINTGEAGKQVSLQLLVKVGSLDERDDQSGVAHMVEHMVFHATGKYPAGLKQHMESLGWRVGSHYNAQTNFERTLYMLTTDTRPASVEAGLDALAEIAGGATIPAEALEPERQIILEEWRTKLGVRERMDRQRRALLRAGSLYPERPTIGTEASIRQQPAQVLRRFYSDWYRPGNMALLIVGNVDAPALQPLITQYFKDRAPAALPARNSPDPELHDQLRVAQLQDPENSASQVGWLLRFREDKRQDVDGMRARLIDRIAERALRSQVRRLAAGLPAGVSSLSSSRGGLGESTGSLGFVASVSVDGHQAGLQQLLLLQERLRRNGLDAGDIAREVAEVRRLNDKGPSQQANRELNGWQAMLADAVQAGRILQDPVQKQEQISAIVRELKPADINARLQQWLAAPDRLLFMLAPGMNPVRLPTAAQVLAQQKKLASAPLPPVLAEKKAAAAPASLPEIDTSGAIVREDDLGHGVQRWTLANGDVVVWQPQPKETVMRFAAHAGAGYRLPGAPTWQWQLAAQLGSEADLAGQQDGELARWSTARKVKLSQQQSETQLVYSAGVPAAQLEDLLRLYAARQAQTEIALPALTSAADQLARQLARRPDTASEQASAQLSKLRYGELPLDQYPDEAALQALSSPAGLATVRQQWMQISQQPVTYFISGPADGAQMKELAATWLAGIARKAVSEPAQPLVQADGYHEARLAIGIEPQGSVRAVASQAMPWSPERAAQTAILSRIAYRQLRQELREKEAGIYRLNYKLSLDPQNRLQSELSFTSAPERLDALWSAALRVLERLPSQLDTAMLNEEIARLRSSEAQRTSDAGTRFARLQLSYTQYGDARYLEDSKQLLAGLNADSVRALAQEFHLARDLAVVKVVPKEGGASR